MYKKIVIIGLGSLGGFFAESMSRLFGLTTLILIDPDIVEYKNVGKSIYRHKDIGKKKVDALKEIILNSNDKIKIMTYPIEYYEEKICMPDSDLVIDCRDIVCSRNGGIDIRMYISFRTLIIDCDRYFKVTNQRVGKYVQYLNIGELASAASLAFQVINSGKVKDLIKKQIVHQVSIDHQEFEVSKSISLYENRPDIIMDHFHGDERIRNLHQSLPDIIECNNLKDLTVIIGQRKCIGAKVKTIKKHELANFSNIVRILSNIIQTLPSKSEFYTICLNKEKDEWFIELLPETGAA